MSIKNNLIHFARKKIRSIFADKKTKEIMITEQQPNNRLGQMEFEEVLLDNISPMILNQNYIDTYPDFWNNLVFNLWKEYYLSTTENTVRHYAKLADIFFGCLFSFPSSSDKVEDIINV